MVILLYIMLLKKFFHIFFNAVYVRCGLCCTQKSSSGALYFAVPSVVWNGSPLNEFRNCLLLTHLEPRKFRRCARCKEFDDLIFGDLLLMEWILANDVFDLRAGYGGRDNDATSTRLATAGQQEVPARAWTCSSTRNASIEANPSSKWRVSTSGIADIPDRNRTRPLAG